jgi:hypothetical protein
VLIAANGVTENDRVGFGHFSYGQGWIWDDAFALSHRRPGMPHAEKRDDRLRDFRLRFS